MVEAMLFGLFTSCMMVDQWDNVTSNVTHIDRLKNENHALLTFDGPSKDRPSERPTGVNEVFGLECGKKKSKNFHLEWLSPFAMASFPPHIRDEIMGFCRPCIDLCGKNEDDGDLELGVVKKDLTEAL
jgi:hypothetical protein